MKLNTITNIAIAVLLTITITSCGNDDDGMMNENQIDFSGTYVQKDQMGRPGINTVLSGSSSIKNDFNVTIPSEQTAKFQPLFLDQAVALHAAFGVEYENNILGLDATTLTTILATDVLQVAPNEPTTYYDGTNVLTGRNLTDDVIDVSLILLFGGQNGDRFNGQDTNGDGMADLPILVTDGVSNTGETPMSAFPYLEAPHSM
ncbi:DUF4331 family protein [Aquimarina muelleri]|uniref:DUF4331 domain-containing protein n=1 Tax=Aquimarina muelleri TaxID=279356 RepID=A0A918K0B6_9FLAO|nr:DUF4331 family protein [Aquimarina muelleri]MCX2765016.1 DUF4331 family protein [Aquimarina muelleri]GGX34976.1 hypothetical protein GCM10007384_39260 [Aquimarina muelleri]